MNVHDRGGLDIRPAHFAELRQGGFEIAQTRENVQMLTDRQYEIARLAFGGQTTGEIAQQLRLSAPTVSNTLRRVVELRPSVGPILAGARAFHKEHRRAIG